MVLDNPEERDRTLFEILSPAESIRLSAVKTRDEAKKGERSFTDSGAFMETTSVETSITNSICEAHNADDVADENLLRHQGKTSPALLATPFVCFGSLISCLLFAQ